MKTDIFLGTFWSGALAVCLMLGSSASANAQAAQVGNAVAKPSMPSFAPGEVWKDINGVPIDAHGGGVMFHEGIYYWYGEIKQGKTWTHQCNRSWGGTRVVMTGVSCYASRDLVHWKNMGNVLPSVSDPNSDLYSGKVLERPKVTYNKSTGKFVMWMHIESEDYKVARAGVAVADKPAGPFRYLGSVRPDGAMCRDMTLFQDDDGKAYLFFASEENATMHVSLLTDDYLKPSGKFERIFVNHSTEAPAVFKHHGRYYFVGSGCTAWEPNAARAAVADSIWGPWKELGNPCQGKDAEKTYRGQSTFVLPVAGKEDAYIFMADRWNKDNLMDSRYLWLPLEFKDDHFEVRWLDRWSLYMLGK